jgi:hypothetical protein
MEGLKGILKRFSVYSPNFKGPDTPQDSINAVLKVINNSTAEKDGALSCRTSETNSGFELRLAVTHRFWSGQDDS